jgi:Cu(I)/Ag(I) efflux system membrane fusion protein
MPPVQQTPSPARHATGWPTDLAYHGWRHGLVRGLVLAAAAALVFMLGVGFGRLGGGGTSAGHSAPPVRVARAPELWTCSMHPQTKLPKPGQCPICFMDLIPVAAGADSGPAARIELSERARALARVETTPVERRELARTVRTVGKVTADETRIVYVSASFPGRLERVFVNYAGILVREGDHLAEIYSPDLLVAQREFLLGLDEAQRGSSSLLEAARRKLELWRMPMDEIARLEQTREPSDRVRIDTPATGWVIERLGYPGMYVDEGSRLFTVADLRKVWVMLDTYELDLALLRYGQLVEFEAEAYAGRAFSGRIAYIDPTLNEVTRTVRVRVNVPNENMQLRPGMFVRATVRVQLRTGGQVFEPTLVGKWISPMHPEIVKDGPGQCDICGMDLVPAESLGFASADVIEGEPLAVPRTAVLLTGRRALVYVETTDADGNLSYEGREIELGPLAGDFYVVQSGLEPNERVVTRGAVQIDSALQIQARPSMMSPRDEAAGGEPAAEKLPAVKRLGVAGGGYHERMRSVIGAYLDLNFALAADDPKAASAHLVAMRKGLDEAKPLGLSGESERVFREQVAALRAALPAGDAPGIDEVRNRLPKMNSAMDLYLRTFGHDREKPLIRMFCPMAFDNRGAGWLQADDRVRNPYFGAKMFGCGDERSVIEADGRERVR